MAALYVDIIRRKQPQGPYFIGGYSFGGVVALEMARLFGRENVAQLVMIDAFAHPKTWPLKTRILVRARKLAGRARHMTARRIVAALWTKFFGPKTDRATSVNNWLGEVNPNLPLPLKQTRIAGDAALIAYTPRRYEGRATFIRAAKTGSVFPPDARPVWRKLIAEFDLHTTRGNHRSILNEDVDALAEKVSVLLSAPHLSSPANAARSARGVREGDPGGRAVMRPAFGARLFSTVFARTPGSPSLASAPSAPRLAGDDRGAGV